MLFFAQGWCRARLRFQPHRSYIINSIIDMATALASAGPAAALRPQASLAQPQMRGFSGSLAAAPLVARRAAPAQQQLRASRAATVATAAPANQKIRIKLKSYWVDLLHDSVDKIKEAATTTGATIAGPVPLPTR